MLFKMNLNPEPFEKIKCGQKTIEMRLYDDRRKPIKWQLPLLKCGYTQSDISTAKPSDMNEYYSDEQISKFGVVGIELEKVK